MDPKLFFSDPDPTFQIILDPDPDPITNLMEEAKAKAKIFFIQILKN